MTIQFAPRWTDATTTQTCVVGNATDIASAANSTLLDLQVNNVSKFVVDKFGELIITPTARTSGSDSLLNLIAPADTTRAAGTEATDINFNLARTVQFAAGNITDQRAIRIQAPTYSFASASTITNASTLSISGAPVAGTNATLTNRWALNVESGNSLFNGEVRVSSALRFGGYSAFQESGNGFFITYQDQQRAHYSHPTIALSNAFSPGYVWASNVTNSATYYGLYSGTNNVIQFRGGTGSQIVQFFNTFTDSSNYERLALQFGTYSSARHAQIAAESAGTGTANINLVLTPKGTGAFILGPPPDGTATGGNVRGANAIDLSTLRSNANQVASGTFAINIGVRNTATAQGSISIGDGNTNSSAECGIAMGYQNTCTTQYWGVAIGGRNTVTNTGYNVAIGNGCVANAAYTGRTDVTGSATAIGENCAANSPSALATGHKSVANRWGQRSHASGGFAVNGDCQTAELVLRGSTTTNAPVRLRPEGVSQRLTIASGQVCQFLLIVTGIRDGGADVATYIRQVTIKNIGGTTSLVGTVNTIGADNAAGTTLTVTADDANDDLAVEPTGVFNQTWRWQCIVYGGELRHGT